MIDRLVDAGAPVHTCCRILGVSRQGYYRYRKRPTSSTELRRRWLTGLIREIHVASRGTYGYRRIHAELTIGMGIPCSSRLISALMTRASIGGLPGPARIKRLRGVATADDLVNRKFHRLSLNVYDAPAPPHQRLSTSGTLDATTLENLRAEHERLNPAEITRQITRIQNHLIDLAAQRTRGTRPAA